MINELGIHHDAQSQQIFSISAVPNSFVSSEQVTVRAFTANVITAWYHRVDTPFANTVATIESPRYWHLLGGPALVSLNKDKICRVAVTHMATYYIVLDQ